MMEFAVIELYQQFTGFVMEDQFTVPVVPCFLKATQWFWGTVLVWLLKIGCVESNPGPRTNEERRRQQPRIQYGSIDSRHGRQWGQHQVAAAPSVCWPFMWWCRSEPLPDEESLLRRRPESEDDELLDGQPVKPLPSSNQESELELENDLLKQQVKLLKSELEREVKQRQEERRAHDESIEKYTRTLEESRTIHKELQAKIDEAVLQNKVLEQQLEEAEHKNAQSYTQETVDRFNKEFQRRKQLEQELEKEVQERKQMTVTLQEEILKRQTAEQDIRLQALTTEAERTEQEIQRRQLQHAMELEVQKRQELSQELEHEMKQRRKETQQRYQLEMRVQEEIQAKQDLELEFKQADLQSQMLEQELRQQLRKLQRVLKSQETGSSECSTGDSNNDGSRDAKGEGGEDDNEIENDNNNDDEEKQEIRLLLLEEFQRLQSRQDQDKLSEKITTDINDGNASKTGSQSQHSGQIGTDSVEVDHEDGAIETNVHYSNALCEDTEVISQVVSEDIRTGGDVLAQGYGEGRERLQHILDKLSTADCEDDTSRKSDYSDILGETVNFQGQDVTVSSLLGEAILPETESLLEAFSKSLSTGNKPVIGCACASDAGYYVPRTLQRKTYVRGDIFKHRTSKLPTVFAVSGMTKQQLQEIVPPGENICRFDESSGVENAGPRFILLNDLTAQHDYNDLCKRARNLKTIHWLKKQPGGLEWKKSEGSIDVIHKYIDLDKSKYFASLTDMEGETVILTGNDGEGKSTYLTNLKREINRTSPATWVIRLNLHEHVSDIDKCDLTEARVIELLSSAAGLGTSLERALLRYSLQTTKNLAVLVDEMGFRHRDDGLELLRVLKDMKMQNLVIAAHPCTTTLIENALSVLAFTLKPLARDELQVLMTKFWETNSKYTNDTLCDEFSTALLNLIEKSFVKGKSPTPLDIKMAAHAFEKGYAAFLMSKVIDLPQHLDVTELYEKYIKREFEMHENTGAGSDEDWTSYLKNITHTSMLSVFPEETVKQFVSHEERVSKASAQFTFLHRCLKDYVTAKWFAENYQSHRSYIRDKYFAAELQSMWVMYDRILAKQYELHTSVLDRDPQKVRGLLSNGSDMNSLDNGGRTALHLAAIQTKYFAEGDPKCVETASLLIDRGADISTVDTVLQWTALRYADTIGSWTMIDRLLQGRADISDMACTEKKLLNRTSLQELASDAAANGLTHLTAYILGTGLDINTPLHSTKYSQQQYGLVHIASENGHVSLLEFLLKSNADVNMCNSDKSTPLHLACRQGNKDCVVMLLHSQARVNQSNKNGDTPLHEAVRSGHCDTVQILLNRNADVYLCNKYGDTPLHVACQGKNLTAVCQLMDTKADKNIRNRNGDSPLDCAILGGHTTLVRYMLRRAGASLLEGEGDGRTPLHLAAVTGDVLMLDCLLQVKPRVDVSTAGGDTALHLACLHGNTDAAVLLLKRGAEINRANKHGNTPLHLASVRGNMDTLNALLERNAQVNVCNMEDNTPLHLASLQGKANAVQCLIKHDADAGTKNREKHTPLQLATIKGDLEVIRLLTEANSDVNVANRYGTTILHQCARNGRVDIVKLLLNSGRCNLDAKDSKGDTPLLAATKSGFADIVECLALCGADIHFRSRDGNAPIHIAVTSENLELVNRLGKLGADLNVRNSQGNTPLHRAVCCGDEVMIRHLVERGVDRTVANRAGDTPFDLAIQMGTNDSILKIL